MTGKSDDPNRRRRGEMTTIFDRLLKSGRRSTSPRLFVHESSPANIGLLKHLGRMPTVDAILVPPLAGTLNVTTAVQNFEATFLAHENSHSRRVNTWSKNSAAIKSTAQWFLQHAPSMLSPKLRIIPLMFAHSIAWTQRAVVRTRNHFSFETKDFGYDYHDRFAPILMDHLRKDARTRSRPPTVLVLPWEFEWLLPADVLETDALKVVKFTSFNNVSRGPVPQFPTYMQRICLAPRSRQTDHLLNQQQPPSMLEGVHGVRLDGSRFELFDPFHPSLTPGKDLLDPMGIYDVYSLKFRICYEGKNWRGEYLPYAADLAFAITPSGHMAYIYTMHRIAPLPGEESLGVPFVEEALLQDWLAR
jgi:hypothetical protein